MTVCLLCLLLNGGGGSVVRSVKSGPSEKLFVLLRQIYVPIVCHSTAACVIFALIFFLNINRVK